MRVVWFLNGFDYRGYSNLGYFEGGEWLLLLLLRAKEYLRVGSAS